MMQKSEIRTYIVQQFATLTDEELEMRGRQLHEYLYEHPSWREANVIAVTVATPREIPTRPLIEKAWMEGKKIVVPKTDGKRRVLDFYTLSSFAELKQRKNSLWEPDPNRSERVPSEHIDLLIVPGLAFNETGYRVGFGGGYYDRFLADYNGHTIAFSLSFQLFSNLPTETHDIPVQTLFTETS
ncbi:5-formyltetrahydrofolate cyclo-ligase [Natribacillus halophilus]|uniref:5-formyltetrahydrofolate cyclo-ligase n=1 Tax=Natribacillus halophilus TaxID=549003 RepID=A0A1G8JNY2_9BACI|nr:5-formyltetrahydrofolate cyclo-ligase [Natribacillus halophilus]SDI32791.1 5-formyltetrahydrofolate cyclo-ligase [Natribacillus halophilus]